MFKYLVIIIIAYILFKYNWIDKNSNDAFVRTSNGILQGLKHENYYSFEGIPYAEPPINENRFEIPKPYRKSWNGIRDAQKQQPYCLQWSHFVFDNDDRTLGSEDCLYLNIYTPNPNATNKYPVIFLIHGGAFMFGGADFYGPKFLMEREIIYVNFYYRLGPLGFLSTEDNEINGNMGLKDQNLALKWVKENIINFGGDPNKITIIGFSAGGASVHLHYMSKLSRNLFQNGISHSGSALDSWVMVDKPLEKAQKLANHIGCNFKSTKELKNCLKEKDGKEIVRATKIFQPWLYNPFTVFGPVIEIESENAFIIKHPKKYIEEGDIESKPWIVSLTKDEGIYPGGEFIKNDNIINQLNDNWNDIAPFLLHFNNTIAPTKHIEVSEKIRKFYLGNDKINLKSFDKVIQVCVIYFIYYF